MGNKLVTFAGAAAVLIGAIASTSAARPRPPSRPSASCPASYHPVLDPGHFVGHVDNPLFPLPVGRVLVYRGIKDGRTQIDTVTVTDRTKVIEGIAATAVTDVAKHGSTLLERTTDWYAQDDRGNVWYLGEATRAYAPDGTIDTSGSWKAGMNGAQPGLIMEATPEPPDAYRQECLSGEAMDTAWVVSRGGSVRVPFGRLHRALRTLEFTQLEPGTVDEKLYAPGLGIVLERTMAGGNEYAKLIRATDP